MALLYFPPSFIFLSFTFLFNLFCFSSLCQRVVLLNFLDTKANPNCLLLSQRERESRRSPVMRVGVLGGRVVRWCWVNLQCRDVLLIWIIVGQGPIALAVGAGGDYLDIFSLVYLFSFLAPSLGTAQYRLKYCLKGPLNPKQQINQIQS